MEKEPVFRFRVGRTPSEACFIWAAIFLLMGWLGMLFQAVLMIEGGYFAGPVKPIFGCFLLSAIAALLGGVFRMRERKP